MKNKVKTYGQLLIFTVNKRHYAVDIMRLREVLPWQPIDHAAGLELNGQYDGVLTLKNLLIPVVDLAKRFKVESSCLNTEKKILLLTLREETVGLIIDDIVQISKVAFQDIYPLPLLFSGSGEEDLGEQATFFQGFCRLKINQAVRNLALVTLEAKEEVGKPPVAAESSAPQLVLLLNLPKMIFLENLSRTSEGC